MYSFEKYLSKVNNVIGKDGKLSLILRRRLKSGSPSIITSPRSMVRAIRFPDYMWKRTMTMQDFLDA